jgi:hypothetical protein
MHDNRRLLAGAGAVVVAFALAGCANFPVQDYADAAPVGYQGNWGHHHGPDREYTAEPESISHGTEP